MICTDEDCRRSKEYVDGVSADLLKARHGVPPESYHLMSTSLVRSIAKVYREMADYLASSATAGSDTA